MTYLSPVLVIRIRLSRWVLNVNICDAYQHENLKKVMCKTLISMDWQGFVYDCDFNQMLEMPYGGGEQIHISALLTKVLESEWISVTDHCFGCTAGQGSSCTVALTSENVRDKDKVS